MKPGLEITSKPDEFCTKALSWRHYDGQLTPIVDVYVGPDEHSSAGPFFDCGLRWELVEGRLLTLLVWEHQRRSGYPNEPEDYRRLRIYSSDDSGRTWKERANLYLDGTLRRG